MGATDKTQAGVRRFTSSPVVTSRFCMRDGGGDAVHRTVSTGSINTEAVSTLSHENNYQSTYV